MKTSLKQWLLLLLCLPAIATAQDDKKYLKGAVPVVDEKVTFTTKIEAPLNQGQIYQTVFNYMQNHFVKNEKFPLCFVAFNDEKKGEIVASGDEYITFNSSSLSLDRSRIYFQFRAQCTDGACKLTMTRINYLYDENRDGGIRYKAEEWITDEYALNKKQDKLAKMTGKFRRKTIDVKDQLFKGIQAALTKTATGGNAAVTKATSNTDAAVATGTTSYTTPTPHVEETTRVPAVVTAPIETKPIEETATSASAQAEEPVVKIVGTHTSTLEPIKGYEEITPDKIPGNMYEMLSKNWMLITAGTKDKFNMMTASFGGFGHLYNKPVFTCYINPSRYTYQLMEKNDIYTITFYRNTYKDALQYCGKHSGREEDKVKGSGLTPIFTPENAVAFGEAWLIIECKKIMAQSLTTDAMKDDDLRQKWEGKAMHKMYIGEVLHVWMK